MNELIKPPQVAEDPDFRIPIPWLQWFDLLQKKINEIIVGIEPLQGQIDGINTRLDSLETQVSDLEDRVTTLEGA